MATFFKSTIAALHAERMQETDDEWTYTAVDQGNGLSLIEVRKDGVLLGTM